MKSADFLKKAMALSALCAILLTGCGAKENSSGTGNASGNKDNSTVSSDKIEMPTADLSNNSKELHIFGWSSMEENETDGVAAEYFEKEYGVKITTTTSTHTEYWNDLAKMVAAGNSPDVVDLSYDKFYPIPLANDLLQPLDGLIDFSNPLWKDTEQLREDFRWKGKIYYPMVSEFLQCWVYYNKTMFKNYGLEEPWALYEKDEWTLDKMCETASAFVTKNNRNEVTQWGLTIQNIEFMSIAGIQPWEIQHGEKVVNNLRDSKIAKVMNAMYGISAAGTGAITRQDAIPVFKSGQCAMLMSQANVFLSADMDNMRGKGALGFAPLPKLDENSNYATEVAIDPGYGLIKGAKNTDLALLWINYLKWFRYGENFCVYIPAKEKTPAQERYNLKARASSASYTDEEVAMIEKYIASNPTKVYVTFRSIATAMGLKDTFKGMLSGSTQWSSFLQEMYPTVDSKLNQYIK